MLEVEGKFRYRHGGIILLPVMSMGGKEQLELPDKRREQQHVGDANTRDEEFKWRCAYQNIARRD